MVFQKKFQLEVSSGGTKTRKDPKNKYKKTDGNDNGVVMMRVYANLPLFCADREKGGTVIETET